MGKTSIEWATHTVNPIRARNKATGAVGHFCEKVSPGCKNCYASAWNERVRPVSSRTGPGHLIGTGLAFVAENRDKVEMFLDEAKFKEVFALERKAARGETVRLFWCDMTDCFGDWVPDEWLDKILAVCALTPHVIHIFVTKRAKRMREYFSAGERPSLVEQAADWRRETIGVEAPHGYAASATFKSAAAALADFSWPLSNVWLLVSAERQDEANERIPELLATPAAVRGVSLEPLLGPIDLPMAHRSKVRLPNWPAPTRVNWVIPGGESGRNARPCAVEWIESVVELCVSVGLAVFAKQTGSYTVSESRTAPADMMSRPEQLSRDDYAPNGEVWAWRAGLGQDKKGGQLEALPPEARVRQFPESRQ